MEKKLCLSIIISFLIISCWAQEKKAYLNPRIEALWKTAAEFKTPESVYYCKKQKAIFVSNINGNPLEKDGNGFISKLTPDGSIIKLEWVSGLNAPKGMGIYKERLFVTDIDRVVEIDIQTENIIRFYEVPNAKFLNDLVIDATGNIYISDMQTNIIHRLYNGIVTNWLTSDLIKGPNGLAIQKDFLFVGTKEKIIRVDLLNKTASNYILNTGSIDGLICLNDDKILYSDWSGNVYITGLGMVTEKLLDTTPLSINAADIGFNSEKNIILIPTFFDNRVMSYFLK